MTTRIHLAILLSSIAMAQQPPPAHAPGRTMAMLVLPVSGFPITAEIVDQQTAKLPDGTSETVVTISKVFRDATGRMRTETNMKGPDGESGLVVQIMNRAEGFAALLIPAEKAGGRLNFPKRDPSDPGGITFLGGPLINVSGTKSVKSEPLGKQSIEGIEFEGERITTTAGEQPSLVGVEEHWFNRELGLFGVLKASGPDQQNTATLRNFDLRAPDPSLFQIPPDYTIRDLKDDLPPQ